VWIDCYPEAVEAWRKGPLTCLARVNPRYPVKRNRGYPFIEMAAIGENFSGISGIGWRSLDGSSLTRFKVGDTLFAKITPCPENGKIAFVDQLAEQIGLGSTELIVLAPLPSTDPRFLFHLVCSHRVRGHATARMEGSTGRQRVPDDVFEKWLLVPIPDLTEQTWIANILDAVDAAILRLRKTIDRAREVKRALVQKLFVQGLRGESQKKSPIGVIPSSWSVVPVSFTVSSFQYGLSVKMDQKGTVPILRMGNLQNGDVVLNDLKYISRPKKIIQSYFLNRGDVLFNRTNSQELVGKIGIYRHDVTSVFASYLIRLIPDISHINSYYLGHVLGSYSAQCRIKRFATPGVQQVNINATNLGKVLIPLPTPPDGLSEQREIAAILEAADAVVQRSQPVLSAYQSLKASLMHDLLIGRLRIVNHREALAS
jgi:type I restriction enzyme, S subunit